MAISGFGTKRSEVKGAQRSWELQPRHSDQNKKYRIRDIFYFIRNFETLIFSLLKIRLHV